jgi:DNA-binding NtrC family response regulator
MSTILIYEEDDLMRGLLTEWLTDAGYHVCTASMQSAQQHREADLAIVSIYMPKSAGARLVKVMAALYPGTPVIAISAQFRAGLSTAGTTAQTLGVAQVIAKPFTREALLSAVKAIIGN